MRTRFVAVFVSTAALIGGVAFGWASAPPARGVVNEIYLTIQAGTEAGTANMLCGWHDNCLTGAGDKGLDWEQSGSTPTYFDSWATYGTGPSTPGGYGLASPDDTESCYRVRVRVTRPDGSPLGDLFYTHQNQAVGGEFTVGAGGLFDPYRTLRRIATTVETDGDPTCKAAGAFEGAHIHQYSDSPFGRNTGTFDPWPATADNVGITEQQNHQNYVTFQY